MLEVEGLILGWRVSCLRFWTRVPESLEVKCLVLDYRVISGRAYMVTQHFWKQIICMMVRGKHCRPGVWTQLPLAAGWLSAVISSVGFAGRLIQTPP